MIRLVQSFLATHAASRFEWWWHRAGDDRAPKTLNRAGCRKIERNDQRGCRDTVVGRLAKNVRIPLIGQSRRCITRCGLFPST